MLMYEQENSTLSYLAKLAAGGIEFTEIPRSGHWPMYANPVAMWGPDRRLHPSDAR
jgi:hypothetical protein